jgi:hypothetical protein
MNVPLRSTCSRLEKFLLLRLFRRLGSRFYSRAAGRLKRRQAGHATQQRENSFAQKPIKLHCEKARAEMSEKPLFSPNLFYQRLLRVTVPAWGST